MKNRIINFCIEHNYFNLNKDVKNVIKREIIIKSDKVKKDTKLLFISDLHLDIVDNTNEIKKLLKNDDKYDFIVLGGDLLDKKECLTTKKENIVKLIELLNKHSEEIMFVSGNHDDLLIESFLVENGLININNDSFKHYNICIFGRRFGELDFKHNKIDNSYFNLFISHSPNDVLYEEELFDYALCGHTHGGQIRFFNKAIISHCKNRKMIYGEWNIFNKKGYTTSGIGCAGIAARKDILPEIVEIKITKKENN